MIRMKSKMRLQVAILCSVPLIMVLGNSMLIPVLPKIEKALNVTEFQTGLLITAFSIPAALTIPFAGFISDQLGRRQVMAPALILYGLGGLIAGIAAVLVAQSFWLILAGRVMQGIGAGGTYQLAMALAGDIFQSRERTKTLGYLEAANGLGKVISPIAGAGIALIAWYAPFYLYGILAIPVAAAIWFTVQEPAGNTKKQDLRKYFQGIKDVFREKGIPLLACFYMGMIVLYVLFGVLSYYSNVLEERLGIGGFTKGFYLAGPVLVMAVTSLLSGMYLQQYLNKSVKLMLVSGSSLVTAGVILAFFTEGKWLLLGAFSLVGLGNGLVLPTLNMLITSAASSEKRGGITCLYGTVRFSGVAAGPPVFGMINGTGKYPIFVSAAILLGAAIAAALFLVKPAKMLPAKLLRDKQGPDKAQADPPKANQMQDKQTAHGQEKEDDQEKELVSSATTK